MTTSSAIAACGLFVLAFYLGYQVSKYANGIALNFGMADLAILTGLSVAILSVAFRPGAGHQTGL